MLSFLRFLEKSGSVTETGLARLLDVENISMKWKDRGEQSRVADEVNIDLAVNAYFLPSTENSVLESSYLFLILAISLK